MVKRKALSSLAAICVVILLSLLLIFEERSTAAARDALSLVISNVLPPLFPYMVVSSVIISLDLLEPIYSLIPTEKLFGLPRSSAQVILCGLLCGFPIGAVGAARLCEDGGVSRDEASVICALSSHASPAFLVGTVGVWWTSRRFGLFLYVLQIIFAIVSGMLLKGSRKSKSFPAGNVPTQSKKSSAEILCRAISDASVSCLAITAYVVFFRVAATLLSSVIPPLSPVLVTLFEFSSGSMLGASIGGVLGAAVTGFAVGFSGLAVFMQICSFTSRISIPVGKVFLVKLSEGVFLSAASAIYAAVCPMSPSASTFLPMDDPSLTRVIFIVGVPAVLYFVTSYCRKRNYFTHGY